MSKLIDYCLNITDGEHGSVVDDPNGDCFLLSNKNVVHDSIVIDADDRKIFRTTFNKLNKRCKMEKGDVLITTVGTLGKTAVIETDDINFVFQRSVGILKPNLELIDPYFLKYLLDSPILQKRLIYNSKGAIQKCIYINELSDLDVDIPDIPTQKKMVESLRLIDEKIKNNDNIIANLQLAGSKIYQRWFNQFNFPNKEGKPYFESKGEMVHSDLLNRDFPINWEVKLLKDIVSKANQNKFTSKEETLTVDLSIMDSDTLNLKEFNTSNNFVTNLFDMEEGTILFGSIRPYLKKAIVAPCDGAVTGTIHSVKVNRKEDLNFVLFTMISNDFFVYAVRNSKGTKMPVVGIDELLEYPVPYCKEINDEFSKLNFVENISKKIMENHHLNKTKQFLIPIIYCGIEFKEQ